MKRLLFSLFLALVACGITFYVVLFCGLSFYLFIKGVNPAEAPGLTATLRLVALPASSVVGVIVFMIGLRRQHSTVIRANR